MAEKRILIVDDNEEVSVLVRQKLVSEGYIAENILEGAQVVEKALSFKPDLVLMDIMLPDIDGADAVKLLQEDPATKDIAVLFLSGIVVKDEGASQPEVKVGQVTYKALGKPFTVNQLLSEIRKHIG